MHDSNSKPAVPLTGQLKPPAGNSSRSGYAQILRTTTIIGGSQGANYLIGVIRTKIVAVLIGPTGVGMVGLFLSATALIKIIAQLGIDQSGVRDIAAADAAGDAEKVAHANLTLRRMCWVTGISGWILTAALAYPLSLWTFGTTEHVLSFIVLGSTLLLGSISGGQTALIRGKRRIGDIARISVLSGLLSTLAAIGLYAWLGKDGVVSVLVATAILTTGTSWYFARRIPMLKVSAPWAQSFLNAKGLIHLGLAFTYGPLIGAALDLFIRSLVVKNFGLDSNGLFQAAWAISGMFMAYILQAMMTDFYPMLTAVATDNQKVNRMVNQQSEIAALLAMPGLIATMGFAPFVMVLLYSKEFVAGADLLVWFTLGGAFQAISWPMGVIQRAKGSGKAMVFGQSMAVILRLSLVLILVRPYGLMGVAMAYPISSGLHCITTFFIARRLSGFWWTKRSAALALTLLAFAGGASLLTFVESPWYRLAASVPLVAIASLISLHGIVNRLHEDHRVLRMLKRIPGGKTVIRILRYAES